MRRILRLLAAVPFLLTPVFYGCRGYDTVRIVTYNVGTFTKFEENSMVMISDMMKELDADVISMNELDSCARRTGSRYQLEAFARMMGDWRYIFGPAMPFDGGSYGDGLASSPGLMLVGSWSAGLPKGGGAEPRALAVMEFDGFVVASTHLDHVSDSAQVLQVQVITDTLKARYGNSGIPVFLCGDMNAVPGSTTVTELKKNWTVISPELPTFPSDNPDICIDYILALNGSRYKISAASIPLDFSSGDVSMASDHLPVLVEVKIRK